MSQGTRAQVLALLRSVGRRYRFLTSGHRWSQQGQTYDSSAAAVGPGPRWRKRLPEERIENNINAWFELRAEIANMRDELGRIDQIARNEIHRLRGREGGEPQ